MQVFISLDKFIQQTIDGKSFSVTNTHKQPNKKREEKKSSSVFAPNSALIKYAFLVFFCTKNPHHHFSLSYSVRTIRD